jgi:hypothetical protein
MNEIAEQVKKLVLNIELKKAIKNSSLYRLAVC